MKLGKIDYDMVHIAYTGTDEEVEFLITSILTILWTKWGYFEVDNQVKLTSPEE